jgi:hypothetical protein
MHTGNVYVTYDYETAVLKVFLNNQEAYTTNFNAFVDKILKNHGVMPNNQENLLPANEMTLIDENDKVKVKVIFLSISGNAYQTQGLDAKGFDFYVLVKAK